MLVLKVVKGLFFLGAIVYLVVFIGGRIYYARKNKRRRKPRARVVRRSPSHPRRPEKKE